MGTEDDSRKRRKAERFEHITVRVVHYQNQRLTEIARETGKSKSELVRFAIGLYLGQLRSMGVG